MGQLSLQLLKAHGPRPTEFWGIDLPLKLSRWRAELSVRYEEAGFGTVIP